MSAEAPASSLGAYELLDVLGRGSSAIVHRARHRDTGAPVAVKEHFVADPSGLESLRREIAILGRLRHPGIVRIVEHGIDDGRPWYAMELIDGRNLDTVWTETPPERQPRDALLVLQQLCFTLAFLHGEGLVHRDLKPANVLVRHDGTPVLVDFGFAAGFAARGSREILETGGELVGSLAYIAPEQLRGEFVDARADLYALGCMLYHAVSGAPPFVGDAQLIVEGHLTRMPARPSARGMPVAGDLEDLIFALLAKVPRERPGYASDVARRLSEIVGGPPRFASPPVNYLYRASFVGRSRIMASLRAGLDTAASGRLVSAFIVGESGVGKTRLAMEVTREAVDRRFAVVTGECLSDVGGPLYPLRPLLRRIADVCRHEGPALTVRMLAGRAGVLATVEPALRHLPGLNDEPPPTALPAVAARERLVGIVVDLLVAWALQERGLVVLDDLQWADELTLAVLEHVLAMAPAVPLMLVSLVRSEEEHSRLHTLATTAGVNRYELARLDRTAIDSIVGDMLAMSEAPRSLVEFLGSQSEGNPFFVSEYLRTAVGAGLLMRAESGGWQVRAGDGAYAALGLPHTLRDLVGRRLEDLGAAARALITGAAILGRDFDPALAADVVAVDLAAQVEALAEIRARQVAEAGNDGLWRFVHDKLREVAYDMIPAERRRRLHAAAAACIEERRTGDQREAEQFATLGHHHAAAGEMLRAGEYFGRAGEYALQGGALDTARVQLSQAISLVPVAGSLDLRRAHWLRLLAETNAGTDLASAIAQNGAALRLLGQRVPKSGTGWLILVIVEILRQGWGRSRARPDLAIEAAQAASRAANSFYFTFDVLPGVASSLRCVNLARAAGEPGRAALPYAQLGYIAGGARLHAIATRCFARAHALRDAVAGNASDFAAALYFHAMYEMGLAHWTRSTQLAREAEQRLQAIGNYQEAEVAGTVLANILHYAGRFDEAERWCKSVESSAERRGHEQHLAWGMFLRGRTRLALGDVPAARDALEHGYERLLPTGDFVSLVMCEGLLARARWCDGDAHGAAHAADLLESRLDQRRLVPLAQCLDGYWAYADVRTRLWASARTNAAAIAARRACRRLRQFALLFPMARPAALRARARWQWLVGQRRRARRTWLQSLKTARALVMPYDEAGALLDLGASENDDHHSARALALLTAMRCMPSAAQLDCFPK